MTYQQFSEIVFFTSYICIVLRLLVEKVSQKMSDYDKTSPKNLLMKMRILDPSVYRYQYQILSRRPKFPQDNRSDQ